MWRDCDGQQLSRLIPDIQTREKNQEAGSTLICTENMFDLLRSFVVLKSSQLEIFSQVCGMCSCCQLSPLAPSTGGSLQTSLRGGGDPEQKRHIQCLSELHGVWGLRVCGSPFTFSVHRKRFTRQSAMTCSRTTAKGSWTGCTERVHRPRPRKPSVRFVLWPCFAFFHDRFRIESGKTTTTGGGRSRGRATRRGTATTRRRERTIGKLYV